MGVFLHTGIFKGCGFSEADKILRATAGNKEYSISLAECEIKEQDGGTVVVFNEHCCGYEPLATELSQKAGGEVMLLYIYDSDYWGYYFYDNGSFLDAFSTVPDYFEDSEGEDTSRLIGNSRLIAEHFSVDEQEVTPYLVEWSEENEGELALEGDTCGYGEDWQVVDFMKRLGFLFPEE